MFTDIVGYTTMMGEDETRALELLTINRDLQKKLVEKHNGVWLKEIGDATLISFSSAIEAVRCAINIQDDSRSGPLSNKLRIGIHLGDVATDNKDVFGEGVNISSRLQGITDPGGIFLSEDIQHLIRSHSDVKVRYLGEVTLKNVAFPVKTYAVVGSGFPISRLNVTMKKKRKLPVLFIVILLLTISIGLYLIIKQYSRDTITSIAVFPFEDLSDNQSQRYFSEGMTNTLIANLQKISALKVRWIKSDYLETNTSKTVMQLGEELDVDVILAGSFIRQGNLVRITPRMIKTDSEELLWSDTYDRDISNILKLHSEIAQKIVSEIQIVVTNDEMAQLQLAADVNPDAYESLLKGQHYLYRLTPKNYELALNHFNDVLSRDSLNAQAYAGIALVWVYMGQWGGEAPLVAAQKARNAANKALELEPNLPTANLAMALVLTSYNWDWQAGVEQFKKTILLNPGYPEPRIFYADLLVSLNGNEEAIAQIDTAIILDPLNDFSYSLKGWVYFANWQFKEATAALNRSLINGSPNSLSYRCLWSINHIEGNFEQAIEHAILFYKHQGFDEAANDIKIKYEEAGYSEALRYAADRLALRTNKKYISSMRVARLYTFIGDNEAALDWLEKAYNEHYVSFFSLNVDPHWESLHAEPRFLKLVDKMNLTLSE